jgi:hypothetical protein
MGLTLKKYLDELQGMIGKLPDFVERFVSTLPSDFMSWDPLSRAQYTEMTIFLSNYLLSSQGDRMAVVGILSTQLLDYLFFRDFPPYSIHEPEDVQVYRQAV